jgi:hypothetical protein
MTLLLLAACLADLADLADLAPEGTVSDGATDNDRDGFGPSEDCNDNDPEVNPDAVEVCDGIDNDCSGDIDDVDEPEGAPFWWDGDDDGYGEGEPQIECDAPVGFSDVDGDCDDTDSSVNPDGVEVCDGVDNDCDGHTDEDDAADASDWYADNDGDGWGTGSPVRACDAPNLHAAKQGDCNDSDRDIHPGMDEACDAIDNDCDGQIDTQDACPCTMDWNGNAYMFCGGNATWWNALAFCEIYNYSLVTVDNEAENTWIDDHLNNWGGRYWAGYSDIDSEDSWVWTSGSGSSYTNWDSGQPNDWGWNQDCLILNDRQDGRWNDVDCSDDYWFICES